MSSITPLLIGDLVVALVAVPFILKAVAPNPYFGFATPGVVQHPALWYRANAFAGWAIFCAAVISAATLMGVENGDVPPILPPILVTMVPTYVAVVASLVYLARIERARAPMATPSLEPRGALARLLVHNHVLLAAMLIGLAITLYVMGAKVLGFGAILVGLLVEIAAWIILARDPSEDAPPDRKGR